GRAEAIEAEPAGGFRPLRIMRHFQRAIADQSGAKQRRRFCRAVMLGKGKHEARIGSHVFGIAAVARVAGEERALAEIFASAPAIGTLTAGPAEPWYADAIAYPEVRDTVAQGGNAPD